MDIHPEPETLGFSTARLERIRKWMRGYIDAGKLPGATTLIARHGKIAFCETMGFGDVKTKKPLALDSILRFKSMSKPITAVAVMMLYEQGLFRLDDPLSEYIPAFDHMRVYRSGPVDSPVTKPATNPITIHHLLTHTSGLTYAVENAGGVPELYVKHRTDFDPDDGPLASVVDRLAGLPLEFEPGTRWEYSVVFDVLGYLVEVVSGKSLDLFLKETIYDNRYSLWHFAGYQL